MPGTHPPNILVGGGRRREYPRQYYYVLLDSRPILVALRSLSLKPISFGYKTPPIRFRQAGGQSAHKARPPPNLELALTPLAQTLLRFVVDGFKGPLRDREAASQLRMPGKMWQLRRNRREDERRGIVPPATKSWICHWATSDSLRTLPFPCPGRSRS